jgi:small GTP-binding protein
MSESESPSNKVVMLGDSSVGKTSIVLQLSEHVFRRMTTPTVGSGCFFKEIPTTKGPVPLKVWDTAGEERYRSFTGLYSQGAVAAIVVFDVTDQTTYESISNWVEMFRETAEPTNFIWVVGNKIDLDGRMITKAKATEWTEAQGFKYFDVCAKTGENIDLVFADVAETIVALAQPQNCEAVPTEETNGKGCC